MIRIANIKDNGRFTVELLRKSGEPFVKIHGCKVINHSGGKFVSGPAFKGDDKWINYTWMDDELQQQIIEAVEAAQPVQNTMNNDGPKFNPDDDIPF